MENTFSIPVPLSAWITIAVIAAVVLVVLLIVIIPLLSFRVTVDDDRIECRSLFMYRMVIRRGDVENISIVNLEEHPGLRPTTRTFGTGLPGYSLGWFRLKNGAEAFLAVSRRGDAVVIRLRDGRYVILAPSDMEGFKEALRDKGWVR